MSTETRNCQNCKQDFVIEPDDFAFYEKIKVPRQHFAFSVECNAGFRGEMNGFSLNENATRPAIMKT